MVLIKKDGAAFVWVLPVEETGATVLRSGAMFGFGQKRLAGVRSGLAFHYKVRNGCVLGRLRVEKGGFFGDVFQDGVDDGQGHLAVGDCCGGFLGQDLSGEGFLVEVGGVLEGGQGFFLGEGGLLLADEAEFLPFDAQEDLEGVWFRFKRV